MKVVNLIDERRLNIQLKAHLELSEAYKLNSNRHGLIAGSMIVRVRNNHLTKPRNDFINKR